MIRGTWVASAYRLLILLLMGTVVLGQFGRIELSFFRALYLHDVIITLLVGLFLCSVERQVVLQLSKQIVLRIIGVLSLFIIFTSVYAFHNNIPQLITALLYLARLGVIVMLGVVLSHLVRQGILKAIALRDGICIVSTLMAWLGLVQYLLFPDTRYFKLLGWDDHYYRLIGTIFDPGFMGIILALGGIFALSLIFGSRRPSHANPTLRLAWVTSISTGIALLLTYSRASYLAFFAGLICLGLWYRQGKVLGIVVLFLLGMVALPRPGGEGVKLERTASAVSRLESIQTALGGMRGQDYLIGKGWYAKKLTQPTSQVGSLQVPNHSSAPENSYIFVFTALGVIGSLLFVALGYRFLLTVVTIPVIVSSAVAISVHALFSNTWFHPFVLIFFVWICVAGQGLRERTLL